ncbi:hypothetical protein HYC85_017992 [Camellia sinensis]|uniref:Uncharacterized protein n=1 Tax=Camellia sinensis TaxID=4442 RepID=A0A7J7GUM9_CAMSI|nr:hypothetical protein HYC85_017992 [Camellia sinensis]
MDDELSDGKGTSEALNSVDESVSETVIVIRSEEQRAENGNPNENSNDSKQDKDYCAIDVKCGSDDRNGKFEENMGGERVCRICHLSSDPSPSHHHHHHHPKHQQEQKQQEQEQEQQQLIVL